ncbi:MAG: hypothetical protein ACKPIC_23885 [Microcystis panniformis]
MIKLLAFVGVARGKRRASPTNKMNQDNRQAAILLTFAYGLFAFVGVLHQLSPLLVLRVSKLQLARVCNACCSYRQLGFAFVSVAREQAQSFTNKQDEPR